MMCYLMSLGSLMPSIETMNAFWHSSVPWSTFSYEVGHLNKKLTAFQRTQVYCQHKNCFIMLRNVFLCATKVLIQFAREKKNVFRKKLNCSTKSRYFDAQTHSSKSPFSAVIPYGQGVTEEYRGFAKQTQLVCTHMHGNQPREGN